MKKDFKEKIVQMNIPELKEKLNELQQEKIKLEHYMFRNDGSSVKTRNYPIEHKSDNKGGLSKLKRTIAFIKNTIHIKQMEVK